MHIHGIIPTIQFIRTLFGGNSHTFGPAFNGARKWVAGGGTFTERPAASAQTDPRPGLVAEADGQLHKVQGLVTFVPEALELFRLPRVVARVAGLLETGDVDVFGTKCAAAGAR